jgi:LCP family protein required for cell wall assembly
VADIASTAYFRRVHRRAQNRTAAQSPTRPTPSQGKAPGARRYAFLKSANEESTTPRATTPLVLAPATTDAAAVSLGDALARLRAQQERQHRPSRWAKLAMHPVRSSVIALLLVFVTVVAAVAAPIAYRSYRAYQDVFVTQVPDQGPAFVAEVNDEGTPVIVTGSDGDEVAEIPSWDGEGRVTLLLLGVDRREEEVSRSDTIILVNIDPAEKTARMISIPRDLRVIVPGFGAHKINAAYTFGDFNEDVPGRGPGLMMRTIETNFGINIDYFAEVDFNGFVEIVDTVGGLTLDVPYPIRDNEYPGPNNQYMRIYFPSGWQHMDGQRVLQYARTRHADNDVQRSARQQQVLLALRQQAVSLDLLRQASTLIGEVGDAVRTDLSPDQALKLARLATEIDTASIEQLSLDQALLVYDTPEEYYFQADWQVVGDIMTSFTGQTIVPPMSALANPRYDTGIRLLDGSVIPGLGPRVLEVLVANGFEDVTTAELPDYGNYPTTQIMVSPSNTQTAFLLAQLLGLPESSIVISDEIQTPTVDATSASSTGSPTAEGTPVSGDGELAVQPLFPTAQPETDEQGTEEPAGEIIIRMGDDMPDPQWYWTDPAGQ